MTKQEKRKFNALAKLLSKLVEACDVKNIKYTAEYEDGEVINVEFKNLNWLFRKIEESDRELKLLKTKQEFAKKDHELLGWYKRLWEEADVKIPFIPITPQHINLSYTLYKIKELESDFDENDKK